mmetsp:Transcript_35980/g.80082  ORF Transcript_35980/g.80082 Transcript_35980/m.80082 type:complete len:81 (+) Transcript_35980:155-397(+)
MHINMIQQILSASVGSTASEHATITAYWLHGCGHAGTQSSTRLTPSGVSPEGTQTSFTCTGTCPAQIATPYVGSRYNTQC